MIVSSFIEYHKGLIQIIDLSAQIELNAVPVILSLYCRAYVFISIRPPYHTGPLQISYYSHCGEKMILMI